MLTAKDVKAILGNDDSYRGDCPMCGGKGSFSVNKTMSDIAWICFKASCKVRGRGEVQRSLKGILSSFKTTSVPSTHFEVPSHFTSIYSNELAYNYFDRVNALDLFKWGYIKLRYDPKQNRSVFLIERGGKVVDAVGRAIGKNPMKWYRYGNSSMSFLYRKCKNTVIVTEDIPSAITVSYTYSAMGLMGTQLSDTDMRDIMQFKNCIIALDPDAHSKGLQMAQRLSPFMNVQAVLTPDDLKYFKPHEVKDLIDGIKTIKFLN